MLEAFTILTDSMEKKRGEQLLSYGKFKQTFAEGADELKKTADFTATEFNTEISSQLNKDLTATAAPTTPPNIAPFMTEMVNICSNFLAQHAEFNKDKGPAFKHLIQEMKKKPKDELYQKEKIKRTYGHAAKLLENAKGLETDHDDPTLSQDIHGKLSHLVKSNTPPELNTDMAETLDLASKYLSQSAVDEVERGPAFDILIERLEAKGSDEFTPQFDPVNNNFAAAYVLKSAPGLCSVTPDPATAPVFVEALHHAVDQVCPPNLTRDMEEVIGRCANYLSAFIRDRDKALQIVLKVMKKNQSKDLVKRGSYTMDYGTGAKETETAPTLVPYLPIKDIADEIKGKLNKDTEAETPSNLKVAVKSAVTDVSKHLSQAEAIKSGTAGTRYPLNLLSAIMESAGAKKLFKKKNYTASYNDGGEVLKYAGKLESDPQDEDLQVEIKAELERGVPTKISPGIASSLGDTMTDTAKHLAKWGNEKAGAVERLVTLMKEAGDAPLAVLQGYDQTYNDGARRIINADTLANDKVDKASYENVYSKLKTLTDKKPDTATSKTMPEVVDEAAQFLSAPLPETPAEKRRVLADLMARKEEEILAREGSYKITYTQGGKEILNAPVGVTTAQDENTKKTLVEKIDAVIPSKKLKDVLHDPVEEGAAYLADEVKGIGEAMGFIQKQLKKEGDKEFLHVGKFDKTYSGASDMLANAPSFGGENPNGMIKSVVYDRLEHLDKTGASDTAEKHMESAINNSSEYIADVATKESGLDAKGISAWNAAGGSGAAPSAPVATSAASALSLANAPSAARVPSSARVPSAASVPSAARDENDEEARRRKEARLRAEAAKGKRKSDGDTSVNKRERGEALDILHKQLQAKGAETFHKDQHSELSHKSASDWLKSPAPVHQSVMESGDTTRLAKKIETKLDALVSKSTPAQLAQVMQDVVVESSRGLAGFFVAENYRALVKDALISEMQKNGNDILIDISGKSETVFFAAQRLKKARGQISTAPPPSPEKDPPRIISHLCKKLEKTIRCCSMPRKLIGTMKEHIWNTSHFLSDIVTIPDPNIAAFVALLQEMDAQGTTLIIEGDIPKTYNDAADYLRSLTTYDDQINLPNSGLEGSTVNNLVNIMNGVPERGYTKADLDGVIRTQAKLLVSYIMLQVQRTALLKLVVGRMNSVSEDLLLRHGAIRRSNADGVYMLSGKNTDQLTVTSVDPLVERKLQIKIIALMEGVVPEQQAALMEGVISDAARYLAVHLLQPHVIKVCKCMKSVFVQCELWCDEVLRRMSRPCCSCSRQLSVSALADLAPGDKLVCPPGTGRAYASGVEVSVKPCLRASRRRSTGGPVCPAPQPTEGCQPTAYMLYSTEYNRQRQYVVGPTRLPRSPGRESTRQISTTSYSSVAETNLNSPLRSIIGQLVHNTSLNSLPASSRSQGSYTQCDTTLSFHTPIGETVPNSRNRSPTTSSTWAFPSYKEISRRVGTPFLESENKTRESAYSEEFGNRSPMVSTDQMGDWHAMMVSLTWNVQAWRKWIQETIDRALLYHHSGCVSDTSKETWSAFQRKIATEALQWRQYHIFSRQLILRLILRYKDKKIVSPTRATVKNRVYMLCQNQMLEIINMFNRWTHWLSVIVKEAELLRPSTATDTPFQALRWNHFQEKVKEYAEDWTNYNTHLKMFWEEQFMTLIPEWLPAWEQGGPVWVVSACGAVPSGAVAAGAADGEPTWVARTTHRGRTLPAALHPSKHCCMLYADGDLHHCTKYQVLCNADVVWIPWSAHRTPPAHALTAAPGVLAGRVRYRGAHLLGAVPAPAYRCHVVIGARPFAFNAYDLLVLAGGD